MRSACSDLTGVFSSRLVPEPAETQLRATARYDPPGVTSMQEFLQHMLRLGDFVPELHNHWLEQLLGGPDSAVARVHRWLTAAEGDCPCPAPRPCRDFVASLRLVTGHLECPAQMDPHPYWDLRGGFLEAPPRRALPAVDRRTQFDDRVGGTHCGRGVGAQMEPVVCADTRSANPSNAVHRHPTAGMGTAHQTAAHGDL